MKFVVNFKNIKEKIKFKIFSKNKYYKDPNMSPNDVSVEVVGAIEKKEFGIFNFLKRFKLNQLEDVPSIFEVVTSLGAILLVFLNLISYVITKTHFQYYGLDVSIFSQNIHKLIYTLCVIISVLALFISIPCLELFLIDKNCRKFKSGDLCRDVAGFLIYCFFIILEFYILIKMSYLKFKVSLEDFSSFWWFFKLIFVTFLIIISLTLIFRIVFNLFGLSKKDVDEKIVEKVESAVFISLVVVTFLMSVSNIYYSFVLENKKQYSFIDDRTVIVYSTEEYYITLDCSIKTDDDGREHLTIYINTQNQISSDNVRTKIESFEDVTFSYDKPEKTLFLEEGKVE